MLIDPCELSPSYVRSIAPYQPGKPVSELAREMGLDEAAIIKLASNENPRGIGPRTRAAIDAALAEVARYPDGNGFELKQALSRRYGVDMAAIVLGNGSNDVLELVAAAFLGPGRAAVMSQHAFAVYPLATQARGARSIVVPAKNYAHVGVVVGQHPQRAGPVKQSLPELALRADADVRCHCERQTGAGGDAVDARDDRFVAELPQHERKAADPGDVVHELLLGRQRR